MRKITFILILLLLTNNVCADVILKGQKTTYTTELKKITESPIPPVSANEKDLWRDVEENKLYVYKNGQWVIKEITPELQTAIQDFKDALQLITDPNIKKALKALGKIVFALIKQTLP